MELNDKVAIVTGASYGIGEATARLLTERGASVALAARSRDRLEALAKELPRSLPVPTDMTRESQVASMVRATLKHYGRVDILVNNAGRGYDAPIERVNPETFRAIFELDLVGPVVAMQQVIPIMREQGGGSIVNVSSGTALMFLPNMSPYSSMKRALAGVSITAHAELQRDHIAVSVVYPYITDTGFERNTITDLEGAWWPEEVGGRPLPPPDSAGFVARKIVEAIESGAAEVFAHDWMGQP